MSDFVLRMKDELEDLRVKLNKLSAFTFSDKWLELDREEKSLLEAQREAMIRYYEVLCSRIEYYI